MELLTNYDATMLLIVALIAAMAYMLIGLLILSEYQHLYPRWLRKLAFHRGFPLFLLHWSLWPLVGLVLIRERRRRPEQPIDCA